MSSRSRLRSKARSRLRGGSRSRMGNETEITERDWDLKGVRNKDEIRNRD
jgi:hypothetical protein